MQSAIAVFNLWTCFNKVIEELQGYYLADIIIYFNQEYRFDRVAPIAESVPGVESVEGWLQYDAMLVRNEEEETPVTFVAPPSSSTLIKPIVIAGRAIEKEDQNAIAASNRLFQMFPDIKVGDTLTVKLNGKESQWKLVGESTITTTGGNPIFYTNAEYLGTLIGRPGRVYSMHVITSSHDVVAQKQINDQLQAAFSERGVRVGVAVLGGEEVQRITQMFDINMVSICCGGFADRAFGALRDRHVQLNVIFGVFAAVALLSVFIILLVKPRDARELSNG